MEPLPSELRPFMSSATTNSNYGQESDTFDLTGISSEYTAWAVRCIAKRHWNVTFSLL
jgi:hypothetical protein